MFYQTCVDKSSAETFKYINKFNLPFLIPRQFVIQITNYLNNILQPSKVLMPTQITKQATIVFEPICVQTNFQKQFGIQIAFYRSNFILIERTDEKVKKTEPLKFTQPQKNISLNPKESIMKIHTTLNYFEPEDKLQTKKFTVQVVYKIDGSKNSIEKEIDVAQFYKKAKEIQTLSITNKPQTSLKYTVGIVFKQDKQKKTIGIQKAVYSDYRKAEQTRDEVKSSNPQQNTSKSIPKPILANNSLKVIKFEDTLQKQKISKSEPNQTLKSIQLIKNQKDTGAVQSNNNCNSADMPSNRQIQTLQRQLGQKVNQLAKIGARYSQLQLKYKDLGLKFHKLNQKCSQLVIQKQKWSSNQGQESNNQAELHKQTQKQEKLQKQCKRLKEQLSQTSRRLQVKQGEIKKLNQELKSLNELNKRNEFKIKELKEESQQFQELFLEMETKHKNTGPSIEQTLKPYKQRIRHLERQLQNLQEEKNFAQNQAKRRQDEIVQLRHKIKTLNEENLRNIEEVSTKQYQIQKLNKKLVDLSGEIGRQGKLIKGNKKSDQQDDLQDGTEGQPYNNFKSEKVLGEGSFDSLNKLKTENNELKAKLSLALKNLENKDNLLKKFDAFSKEARKQLENELELLKKENQQLKLRIQSDQSPSAKNQVVGLQLKLQLQKVKKELEYKSKSQRQVLIDKSEVQLRNKRLQEEVIKCKESIGNILNIIHEFGDQGLIEQVNMFLG